MNHFTSIGTVNKGSAIENSSDLLSQVVDFRVFRAAGSLNQAESLGVNPKPSRKPLPKTLRLASGMGVSENRGTLFWGPHNKDPII